MYYTPVTQYPWTDDFSNMHQLTCKNHPTAQYSTKNPYHRGLHLIRTPEGFHPLEECPCAFKDLVVVTAEAVNDHSYASNKHEQGDD